MQTVSLSARLKQTPLKSAVVVQPEADGTTTSAVIYRRKRTRRVSKRWRPFERTLRRMSRAQAVTASDYLRRHERSSQKKKNGALRDLGKNVWRAQRKGRKKLKIRFL
jgi:hypothetical protein